MISINNHGTRVACVAGHHDCAGNPEDKEAQLKHIAEAVKLVRSWDSAVEVIGFWVDEHWQVHELKLPAAESSGG